MDIISQIDEISNKFKGKLEQNEASYKVKCQGNANKMQELLQKELGKFETIAVDDYSIIALYNDTMTIKKNYDDAKQEKESNEIEIRKQLIIALREII